MHKQSYKRTDKATVSSVMQLLNPLSAFTAGQQWMPKWMQEWSLNNLGGRVTAKNETGGSFIKDLSEHAQNAALNKGHMLWKMGMGAATAAAIVAVARMLNSAPHYTVQNGKIRNKPQYDVDLKTTTDAFLPKKVPRKPNKQQDKDDKKQVQNKQALNKEASTQTLGIDNQIWMPSAAIAAASILAYKIVDKRADKRDRQAYLNQYKQSQNKLQRLQIARAALARRNLDIPQVKQAIRNSPKQLRDIGQAMQTKTASQQGGVFWSSDRSVGQNFKHISKQVPRLVDLACAAVLLASGVGAYSWFADRNQARKQLAAARKAQQAFVKVKSMQDTMDRPPMSRQLAKYIVGKNKKQQQQKPAELPQGLLGQQAAMDLI